MKKYINISYLLASLFVLLTACSEEIFSPNTLGDNVTLSLSYSDVSPKEITVNTRAGEENEKRLDNLYIYIFDGEGKLKGFKAITSGLDNNTSNSRHATINNILTRAGESYIYAVANINTALYPVETSKGTIVDGKLPIELDEEKAQAGEYKDFTKDMLLELPFERKSNTIDITDAYLMSGAVNEGQAVTITETGIANEKNVIRLSRIVSKVKFTIKAGTGKSFKLNTYDIRNVALNGTLVGTIDNNTRTECTNVSDITGIATRPNEVENGAQYFEVYAPENLQTRKGSANNQAEREDDKQSTPKQFVNAPEYGTYVVLKGQYEETKSDGNRITANVVYYVHLGDIKPTDYNNYDVERNCKYTYNITVDGVNKIIVEAKKEEGQNLQPGAEGLVLEYGTTNKTLTLDSHYDYMVMRFYQSDIKQLKHDEHNPNLGYYYQVYALGKHTGAINVGKTTTENGNPDKVDTSWIEFAIKCSRDNSTSKYSSANDGRGEPCSYPGTKYKSDLYSIEKFLKLLYDKADDDSFWTGTDDSKGRYIDATCFISENYYKDLSWDQYVNDVDQRAFYVANTVYTSNDGRSVYATTQYGLHQYNIQTFYDRSQAGSVIAYGCETINDEAGKKFTALGNGTRSKTSGTDEWNGRTNMLADINSDIDNKNYNWDKAKSNTSLVRACLSRNRDLNGDGKISNDEIRWYAPTQAQYAGLWIGEEIMSSDAKLYNKSTNVLDIVSNNEPAAGSRMLYYAADKTKNTFFSEEGMADANDNATYPAAYVRCLRNLESYDTNDKGYAKDPDKYYSYDSSKRLIKLDKVDDQALNITGGQSELQSHTERSNTNKPAKAFYFAKDNYGSPTQQQVVEGTFKCYGNYNENGTSWRVPNQREFTMMVLANSSYVAKTYCRTKFSNEKFRYSWTYNGNFTMDVSMKTTKGSVRCIKAIKE